MTRVSVSTAPRVVGTVALSQQSAVGLNVQFTPVDADATSGIRTVTDDAGKFTVTLPEPGDYHVALSKGNRPLFGQERLVSVHRGLNRVDWAIDSGSISIDVRGWDAKAPLSILVNAVAPRQPGAYAGGVRVFAPDDLPVVIDGLAFGSYAIQAREDALVRSGAGRSSERPTAIVSREEPTASVVLDLRRYDAELRVVDAGGAPVVGAIVLSKDGVVREAAPGVYSLRHLSAGTMLQIRPPGLTPVCKVAPPEGELVMTADEGRDSLVRFVGPDVYEVPPGRFVWGESDCPVSAASFPHKRVSGTGPGSVFLLKNFPVGSSLGFIGSPFEGMSGARAMELDSGGVVTVHVSRPVH